MSLPVAVKDGKMETDFVDQGRGKNISSSVFEVKILAISVEERKKVQGFLGDDLELAIKKSGLMGWIPLFERLF
jgi:hypothetical protein